MANNKGSDFQWSDERDKEIAERLQKLKRDSLRGELPSEGEIAERLAKLKGMDPSVYKAPPIQVYRPVVKKTAVEEADDLMKQLTDEVALESKFVKSDDIAARLAQLRGQTSEKKQGENEAVHLMDGMDLEAEAASFKQKHSVAMSLASQDLKELVRKKEYNKLKKPIKYKEDADEGSSDDDAATNALIERLMATNCDDEMEGLDSLTEHNGEKQEIKSEEGATENEFPWCVICTNDAVIRCFGCDGDLYCKRCYKECHDNFDIKDHKTCPFIAPRNPAL